MRYFIQFSYKGTNYHGWQIQPNAVTIQEKLNRAVTTILSQNIELVGAGRTDTGVHASQMFAHFDTDKTFGISTTIFKLNSFLPKDIAVQKIIAVHPDAHARFDATERTYHYFLHQQKDPFLDEKSYYFNQELDVEEMNKAAKLLLGFTDFQCFSKVHTDVNTFNCKIISAFWSQNNHQLQFTITADRFLRNMVRAIVGTLISVGLHKISIEDFIKIIENKDRSQAGFSVPAQGLFLTEIKYPYINNTEEFKK